MDMEEEEEIVNKVKGYLRKHPEFIEKWLEERKADVIGSSTSPKALINAHVASLRNNNNNNSSSSGSNSSGVGVGSGGEGGGLGGDSGGFINRTASAKYKGLRTSSGGGGGGGGANEVVPGGQKVSSSPETSVATLSSSHNNNYSQLLSKRNSISSDRFHYFVSSLTPNDHDDEDTVSGHSLNSGKGGGGGDVTPNRIPSTLDLDDETLGGSREDSNKKDSGEEDGEEEEESEKEESDQFINLVKSISNELNIECLCEKIRANVKGLAKAEHVQLFLARGPREQRYLVPKNGQATDGDNNNTTVALLSDKSVNKTDKTDAVKVPFDVGIAGYVARSKEAVNITQPVQDPRYKPQVDCPAGLYPTPPVSLLALPICNNEGQVIGVAQLLNKTEEEGSASFSESDVETVQRYLTFCGIGIQNAQLFHTSVAEYRKNQLLLNLARSIFEEQTGLERLVSKIMKEARDLLRCERSLVYLRDVPLYDASQIEKILTTVPPLMSGAPTSPQEKRNERKLLQRRESKTISVCEVLQETGYPFDVVYDLRAGEAEVKKVTGSQLEKAPLTRIAQYVAMTTEILNIGDAVSWYRESSADELVASSNLAALPRSILCMPIYNGQRQVIGVAQLINKVNCQPFTDSDAITFEAFAIFCGLGIHNTQLYEGACKLMAKQSVALECLSYHATASPEDTDRLRQDEIPSCAHFKLYSYAFSDFGLTDSQTCQATVRMFLELKLVDTFHIPYNVLCRWILSVKKNYRPVKYHNWRHAFNVAQTMFTVLKIGKMEQFLDELDILGLMVACLCHDLDHRGTNNAFQKMSASPLAVLYSTSTMEHHHFDQCVMILSSDGNNIFQDLSADHYRKVMKIVEKSILSTDLAMYFRKKEKFIELVDNGEISWQGEDKKELLCGMMMTACDVAAISKPWEIQHKIAKLVADEFFDQGDLEKERLNQQPVAMMDREKKDELPKMQLCFIDVICLPLYKMLSDTFPWLAPLYDGCRGNRKNWQDLAEKVDMGLTWIDHDIIEKPIEEFAGDSASLEDVNLIVTTLHCQHEGGGGRRGGRKGKFKLKDWLHSKRGSLTNAADSGTKSSGSSTVGGPLSPTSPVGTLEFSPTRSIRSCSSPGCKQVADDTVVVPEDPVMVDSPKLCRKKDKLDTKKSCTIT